MRSRNVQCSESKHAHAHLAEGWAEQPLGEGEDKHVEEARRDAGSGPQVRPGGKRERDSRGGDGEPILGQRAAVDDVAAGHDGAGQSHAHSLHQLPPQLRRGAAELCHHRPERRGGAPRPPSPAPEEGVVAGEEGGGEAKATSGHFGFFPCVVFENVAHAIYSSMKFGF